MSDWMNVPYPKEVRRRADEQGHGLLCLDINPPDGVRMTLKGPMHPDDEKYLRQVWKRLIKRQTDREAADDL